MSQEVWTAVDRYVGDLYIHSDPVLEHTIQASVNAGLPAINVSASQGMLLHLLVRLQNAKSILEIGTLGGYSTTWLARALPEGGRLITLEMDPKHAEVAQANFKNAGLDGVIELRLGRAIDSLPKLAAEGLEPFDFIFIDADKMSIAEYFDWSLKLSRPGSMILVDNVVRNGGVVDPSSSDPAVVGVRRFNEKLAAQTGVQATTIQTVGSKGYDGFTLIRVNE
jgi:predicted O-methyltransferase YrrM